MTIGTGLKHRLRQPQQEDSDCVNSPPVCMDYIGYIGYRPVLMRVQCTKSYTLKPHWKTADFLIDQTTRRLLSRTHTPHTHTAYAFIRQLLTERHRKDVKTCLNRRQATERQTDRPTDRPAMMLGKA